MSATSATSEIRHLNPRHVNKLGEILSVQDEWKSVMGHIQKEDGTKRFTSDQIRLIERESQKPGRKTAFEILVDEWGTMGGRIKRPTIKILLTICLEVDAIRAATYISETILEEKAFDFSQCDQQFEDDISNLQIDLDNSDVLTMPVPAENTFAVPSITFAYLKMITEDFGKKDKTRKIGSGGFADVFLGITLRSGHHLAIKKLKDVPHDQERNVDQLNSEVGEVSRLKHPYIIQILAYSNDSHDNACLVYPYYKNGNLEGRLRCRAVRGAEAEAAGGVEPLNVSQRMKIILGVAEGLQFLHTQPKKLIHRDIKSSNILLDDDLLPKIADFGLLRHASTNNTETVNIKGTLSYMAPEAARGDISVKVDVFSFGGLLLEILTGIVGLVITKVEDVGEVDDSSTDLISYVQELEGAKNKSEEIKKLLDARASWPLELAIELFRIAQKCISVKGKRPFIQDVFKELNSLHFE